MYVIGISSGLKHGHHDGGAVLMQDGRIIAASEEERFTLAKHARGELPRGAIRYCLRQAGIRIEDVDYICSPLKTYTNYERRLTDYFKYNFGHSPKVVLLDHHMCHAASTYFPSGFSEATVVCVDNSGDSSSGGVFRAKGSTLEPVIKFDRENSLGLYYGMMTQYLGYQMTNDEYKVMGLASYGEPRFEHLFDSILTADEFGYRFNQELDKRLLDKEIYTTDFSTRQEQIFTTALEDLLGPRRLPGTPVDDRIRDIAASAQARLERIMLKLVKDGVNAVGSRNVCLAGGVALNCKANMEVKRGGDVDRMYVPSVPHDAGVALGAAILQCVEEGYSIEPVEHAYWGPEYENDTIRDTLVRIGAQFEDCGDPVDQCVTDLHEGKTVGWHQGRMEFGPRALGNRSIIAHPGLQGMKDKINTTIKYREEYRPFCPSVISESQTDFFDDPDLLPFMNVTTGIRPEMKQAINTVVHVDDTARIQTVREKVNPLYHRLISSFAKAGGPPVLLNTSLNINEQPTVNAPLEALHTYFCSGMDTLYLGPFRVTKPA